MIDEKNIMIYQYFFHKEVIYKEQIQNAVDKLRYNGWKDENNILNLYNLTIQYKRFEQVMEDVLSSL